MHTLIALEFNNGLDVSLGFACKAFKGSYSIRYEYRKSFNVEIIND
jgi:hypothetical protein